MVMHLFRYRLKCLLRDRDLLFWSMVFPVLLATLFYFSFGHLLGSTESFEPVKVAIVNSPAYQQNAHFRQMIAALAKPGANRLLAVTLTDEADAMRRLDEGSVVGVISVGADDGTLSSAGSGSLEENSVRLTVTGSGIGQSILKAIVDEYVHTAATVTSIVSQNPSALAELIGRLENRKRYTQQVSYSDAVPDTPLSYFYALVAMACLYAGFWGMRNSIDLQADLSDQGARRSVAPTHKLAVVLCDFAAALLISLAELLILLAYLIIALGVDFGNQIGCVLLTCLAGSIAGVSLGTFIGTLFRRSEGAKVALLIGASNLMCFLAGLMYVNMKHIVARHAPFVSYINPATLISDAFYSLYIFDNHRRFFLNIGLLCAISAVMCFASYVQLRRERYASL